jgi:hypothetical protein
MDAFDAFDTFDTFDTVDSWRPDETLAGPEEPTCGKTPTSRPFIEFWVWHDGELLPATEHELEWIHEREREREARWRLRQWQERERRRARTPWLRRATLPFGRVAATCAAGLWSACWIALQGERAEACAPPKALKPGADASGVDRDAQVDAGRHDGKRVGRQRESS